MRAARLRRRDLIRASKAQLNLLLANSAGARGEQVPAIVPVRRRREDLPENQLESQIQGFLNWRGFTTLRLHVGLYVPHRVFRQVLAGQLAAEAAARNVVRVGEEGMPDWWSARPIIPPDGRAQGGPWPWQAFFWEAKALSKKPSDAQLKWIERHKQVGLEAAWFNQFAAGDRPTEAVEPRDSHVFDTWFSRYFTAKNDSRELKGLA
jgi:hypothetical protein